MIMSSPTELNGGNIGTILRRNSSNTLPVWSKQDRQSFQSSPQISRMASDDNSMRSYSGRIPNELNSFNDMGHLSRRIYNDGGENRFTSSDFENSFGYRKVFDGHLEVTAITPTTIARCMGSIVHQLIVEGEVSHDNGHFNAQKYEEFCGGGKSSRSRPNVEIDNSASFSGIDGSCSSPFQIVRKKFLSKAEDPIPCVDEVIHFVAKLCNDAQMEYECIIISIIYVRRLIKRSAGQLVLLSENWKGIVLSCIVLSNKVWDDFHMKNSHYSRVFNGLTVERINLLEVLLLTSIDYCCNVSPSAYAKVHFEVQSMITMITIENGKLKRVKNLPHSKSCSRVHPVEATEGDIVGGRSASDIKHPSPCSSTDCNDEKVSHQSSTRLLERTGCEIRRVLDVPSLAFASCDADERNFRRSRKELHDSADVQKEPQQKARVLLQYDESGFISSPNVPSRISQEVEKSRSSGMNNRHFSKGKNRDTAVGGKSGGCCFPFLRGQRNRHNTI